MDLIIVESPTKSKTIKSFLKKGYNITSSFGHVRDLPKTKLGIDVENNFEPQYKSLPKAKKTIDELKKLVKKADTVYLATDPDREGEAIAWHLVETLKLDKYQRIAFHEITKSAVEESLNNPREIDMNLVDAQQARRFLDRIVGYKLSPFLWKKVARGLSAGRVQSAALKFVVDREKEINDFQKEEYWTIDVELKPKEEKLTLIAQLVKINNQKVDKFTLPANDVAKELEQEKYLVSDIAKKNVKKSPLPPFITSTLQQEAYKKLRFSAKMTMRIAQQLYEKGLTTYHRTDSYNLSSYAISEAKEYIVKEYGEKYWSGKIYKTKSKSAQEAHEAIRPSNPKNNPLNITNLDEKQTKLYSLIWSRFTASLMSPAIISQTTVEIETVSKKFHLRSSGQTMVFEGFLRVYPIKTEEKTIPEIEKSDLLDLVKVIPEQHFTQPKARYSEATLIKALEENGIGRPSTYATIMSTIQERNYVSKNEEKRFIPSEVGIIVSDLLSEHFKEIVDPNFTAGIEQKLDLIAINKADWKEVLSNFYNPFIKLLKQKEMEINKVEKETDEICEKCKSKMVLKVGRFGSFLACSNYPECKNTKSTAEEESSEPCEECGAKMVLKRSKFGTFWGCSNYPTCKNIRKVDTRIGVKCPKCEKGDVVMKKSKKGRSFYGCSNYPECDFVSNKKPK
ncbi:MAG: type I DNA topoisomerase [Candidatus Pacebacteria bacterium]|nr:type I DNA topoisomerase [Candidatus Paceibacterota bacterium]